MEQKREGKRGAGAGARNGVRKAADGWRWYIYVVCWMTFQFFFLPFSFAPFRHQCNTMHRIKVRNYASYRGATHTVDSIAPVRLYDIQTNMNEERNTDVKKM